MSGHVEQIEDVLADPEYDQPDAQTISGFRSLLGVPISREGRIAGVSNLGRARCSAVRRRRDRAWSRRSPSQVSVAIEIARLLETIERQRTELARFVSPQIAALVSSPDGEQLLAGHRRQITAVFFDLRGFTHFSETAEPEELLGVLRDYHARSAHSSSSMAARSSTSPATAILVFFNDPIPQDDHARASGPTGHRDAPALRRPGRGLAQARL